MGHRYSCFAISAAVLIVMGITGPRSLAQTSLEAKLTPTVIINGPLNSLHAVQYSTNITDPNVWTVLSYVRLDTTPKPFYDYSANGDKRFYRTQMVGVADTNLVWIPPGSFLMGSPTNEEGRISVASSGLGAEGPQTLVTLTTGFLMGRFEVRCADWLDITGETKSTNLQSAVTEMPWSSATNYCALKTAADLSFGKIPPGWSYRLPTEAEWEYACRAGTTNQFSIGVGTELRNDDIRKDANINGTTPYPASVIPVNPLLHVGALTVGKYAPNAFGLYDIHGNVEEWCWDNISGAANNGIGGLPGGSVTNPIGTLGGFRSVYRGGGPTAVDARAAARKLAAAVGQSSLRGFRVVLVPPN